MMSPFLLSEMSAMRTASMQSLHSDLAVSHMCCVNVMMTFEASVHFDH
jgi:hypothetical protein